MVNKFDIHWQVVRLHAKSLKGSKKIGYVIDFLQQNRYHNNWRRVHNWLQMLLLSYKKSNNYMVKLILSTISDLESFRYTFDDNQMTLKDVNTTTLLKLHKDLSKRKYNFQYNKIPKAHVEFMLQLDSEIELMKEIEEILK